MSKKPVFQFRDAPREMPSRIPLQLRLNGDWGELYGRFGDVGMCLDAVLDLDGMDVLAAAQDHVARAR